MNIRVAGAISLGLLLMACAVAPGQTRSEAPGDSAGSTSSAEAAWRQRLVAWRTQHENELKAPDGWLTLVALDWLKPGINSVGSAPDNAIRIAANAPAHLGLLTVSGNTVQLLAPTGGFPGGLMQDGRTAREGPLNTSEFHPSILTYQGLTFVVLPRGDRFALRVKDAASPARTAFHGLPWYEPDLRYTVEAKWIPYRQPQTQKIPTVVGTTLTLPAPGVAEFTLHGKKYRVVPVLEDPHDTTLFFILRDKTSETTTYGGGRFLRTNFPDHGLNTPGTLILDFNQLYNPPCAYTPYATCPLPPEQNRLSVAIEAGEKRYQP